MVLGKIGSSATALRPKPVLCGRSNGRLWSDRGLGAYASLAEDPFGPATVSNKVDLLGTSIGRCSLYEIREGRFHRPFLYRSRGLADAPSLDYLSIPTEGAVR